MELDSGEVSGDTSHEASPKKPKAKPQEPDTISAKEWYDDVSIDQQGDLCYKNTPVTASKLAQFIEEVVNNELEKQQARHHIGAIIKQNYQKLLAHYVFWSQYTEDPESWETAGISDDESSGEEGEKTPMKDRQREPLMEHHKALDDFLNDSATAKALKTHIRDSTYTQSKPMLEAFARLARTSHDPRNRLSLETAIHAINFFMLVRIKKPS